MSIILRFKLFAFFLLAHSVVNAQNIKINEICSVNYICNEDDFDEHEDWVEFYNAGGSSVNMAGMYLTDDYSNLTKFQIPSGSSSATTIAASGKELFWFDDETYKGALHANFKLNNSGEQLALVASDGVTIIDSITFPALSYDVSYGRTTNGSSSWSFFPVPTPGSSNTGGGYTGIAGKAAFDMDAGFYTSSIQVVLTTPDPSSTIYYSLNGDDPSSFSGTLYTGPVNISSTKVMRARVYKSNYIPGEITTRSYFINRPHDLPILSVVTDPDNLWDDFIGIYTFGYDDYDHYYPYYGANFWHGWKVPAHIELFESSGAEVVSQNLKLSITGNTSRVYAQKSLNLEAEDALGKNSINYQLLPQLPIASYKSFKMRNGGSDWSSTGIRDAFNHTLLEGVTTVDHQSNRPVILYLNGAYWGILNLTEKIDEDYINEHYPSVDKDEIDLLYSNAEVKNGDADNYNDMIDFITNNSLSQQSNYNYIKTQIEIRDFIDYFQTRIYYASTDWPHKNIYFWRPKDLSMKWRWIMWDTDRSDLLSRDASRQCSYDDNTLAWATTSSSNPWARFLLNNMLLSSEFKAQFISQYANHMNFTFCPNRTDSILDVFRDRLYNEMPAHVTRWKNSNDTLDYYTAGYYQSRTEWNVEVDTIKLFFDNRAQYMRQFLMQQFSISGTSELTLNKVPPHGGSIEIDSFTVPPNPCDLIYFDDYPITLKAKPSAGFVFAGWTTGGGNTMPITWIPDGDTTVTAYFTSTSSNQPTVAASNYSATVSNCTDIDLSWTPGNGFSRMVVAREAAPVNAFPVNFQSYIADDGFGVGDDLGGGNYVVYSGNSNSCTVEDLDPGVTYHFAIFEFNGTSTNEEYNTTNYLTGNTTASVFIVNLSASSNVICLDDSTTLTANGGITYQWSPSAGLSATSGSSVNASPANSIYYTVLATDNNGCQSTEVVYIAVNPLPNAQLSTLSDICASALPVTLIGGTPSGGVYSGTGVVGGVFDPAVAGVGSHTIVYTYTDINGCSDESAEPIEVLTAPSVSLNTFNDLCIGSPAIVLSGGSPSGGIYSGPGVVAGMFNPTAAGIGSHTITYSYTNIDGCSDESSESIVVAAYPIVSLTAPNSLCIGSPVHVLTGGAPSGGNYSGVGVSAGTFSPLIAGIGNHLITYFFTNSSGCANEDTASILVGVDPVISLGNDTIICADGNVILDAGFGLNAYVWSTGATSQTILIDSSGYGLGTFTFVVTGTGAIGCVANDEIDVTFDICAAIKKIPELTSVLVFPNPFGHEITILTGESNFEVTLIDLLGKVVFNTHMTSSDPVLSPNVGAGVYFLKIRTSKAETTVKLVKTN